MAKLDNKVKAELSIKQKKLAAFGWWFGNLILVSKAGIFGDYNQVNNSNAIDVLTSIYYLIIESE